MVHFVRRPCPRSTRASHGRARSTTWIASFEAEHWTSGTLSLKCGWITDKGCSSPSLTMIKHFPRRLFRIFPDKCTRSHRKDSRSSAEVRKYEDIGGRTCHTCSLGALCQRGSGEHPLEESRQIVQNASSESACSSKGVDAEAGRAGKMKRCRAHFRTEIRGRRATVLRRVLGVDLFAEM